MTDIKIDITQEPTYELRLGWLNITETPTMEGPNAGKILRWRTKGGIPVMVPDQWAESLADAVEELPRGASHVKIGQSNEAAMFGNRS